MKLIANLVTAALTSSLALAAQTPTSKTRLAHIGLELDGSWSWIEGAQQEPEAELVGVADDHPQLLAKVRSMVPPGTRLFATYLTMLDEAKPDAVLVTMPNSRHLEILKECARRKIHVWFQMPMATNATEATEMERAAREAGITLMINYHTLWSKSMQAITARVQAGDIGPVNRLVIRHAFNSSKSLSPYYSAYFLNPALHGGGALMNQAPYGIDYAVWMLGRPDRVFAIAKRLRELPGSSPGQEDESWLILDYPKATAIVYAGWWIQPAIGPGVGELMMSGPKGVLQRDLGKVTFVPADDPQRGYQSDGEPRAVAPPDIRPERRNGIAHFLDCLRNNKPVDAPHSPALNVIVHEVIDAAYESIRTGRVVALREN